MKNVFLFLLVFLSCLNGFSQTNTADEHRYKAVYQLTYRPDSTDANSIRSEDMVLYLGDKTSRFSSRGTAFRDSLMENLDRSDKSMAAFNRLRSQIPETKFNYYVYKGIPTGKFSYTSRFRRDRFLYIGELDNIDWQMQAETKEVAGYKAQKATGSFAGRAYTAWFTSEIPIPDGPYKFNGLPGLIVEITDQKEHYSFVLTAFEAFREPIPFTFVAKDFISTNKDKFLDVLEENKRDPLAVFERQGGSFGFKPGQKERMMKEHKEKLKKENNPLELE